MTRLQHFYTNTPEQFAIRLKHPTTQQLLRMVKFIHDGCDNSDAVGAFLIDVAKTFDTMTSFTNC